MQNTFATWPAVFRACISTYFKEGTFGAPNEIPANAAYMLAGLQRYRMAWDMNHAERHVTQSTLDAAAAHEIYYQHTRGRTFRRPAAALSACIYNIAVERPERILERHERRTASKRALTP